MARHVREPVGSQIFPVTVDRLDEGHLLGSEPAFDLFLASDGGTDIGRARVIDQPVNVVAARESRDLLVLVLVDAALQIVAWPATLLPKRIICAKG